MKKISVLLFMCVFVALIFNIGCEPASIIENGEFVQLLGKAGIRKENFEKVIASFEKGVVRQDTTYTNFSSNDAKERIYLFHAYTTYLKYTGQVDKYYDLAQPSYMFDLNALDRINIDLEEKAKKDSTIIKNLTKKYLRIYPAIFNNNWNFKLTFVFVMEDAKGNFISVDYPGFDYDTNIQQIQIVDEICPNAPNCPPPSQGGSNGRKLLNEQEILDIKAKF
jgi:hypothetical protein